MPHATNRRAFRDADTSEPFFRLYTLLVAAELALKDQLASPVGGHDIERLAKQAISPMTAGLGAQLTTVSASLSVLKCTNLQGASAPVNAASYPGLRYLRHETDFPGETKRTEIESALVAVRQLVEELRLAGVPL